ncbi:MAG: glycosyltransferase family 1 protein [Candidatus Fermentibacteraceae bacterium]
MKYDGKVAIYAAGAGNRGGTGVYIQRLLAGLAGAGLDWVLPLGGECRGTLSRVLSDYISVPLSARGFSVVHLPSFAGSVPPGVKTVVTVHDLAFLANPGWFPFLKRHYYRLLFPRIARGACRIIADSSFTAGEVVRLLAIPEDRVRTVYLSHGSPRSDELADFRGARGLVGDYAVCACTLEPRKNIAALLEAWRLLQRTRPGSTLVIVGRWGWGKRELRDALGNSPGVIWTGPLSRRMLNSAVAQAKFLVYPSVYEGFGLPPLEAAALGVPSVLGPALSLREVYGSVARFSDGDPSSLARAMLEEFDSSRSSEDLMDFAASFSELKMARDTAEVYRECLQ